MLIIIGLADKNFYARIIDDAVGLVNNVVGSVLGSKSSISRLAGISKDLLTPVIHLSIFGK